MAEVGARFTVRYTEDLDTVRVDADGTISDVRHYAEMFVPLDRLLADLDRAAALIDGGIAQRQTAAGALDEPPEKGHLVGEPAVGHKLAELLDRCGTVAGFFFQLAQSGFLGRFAR